MKTDENRAIAQALLTAIGSGASPAAIAELFDCEAVLDIPGDVGALPWIGRKVGRDAVAEFIADNRRFLTPVRFEVHEILTSALRAVVIGELAAVVAETGRLIETGFAIVLTIENRRIKQYHMLEDSFHVSSAARP